MEVNTLSKQMLFTTVRITAHVSGGASFGTGFIMDATSSQGSDVPVLVTNKHVIAGATDITLTFIARQAGQDSPDLGEKRDFTFSLSDYGFIGHPQDAVDIAAIPLHPIIADHYDTVFYRMLPLSLLPTAEQASQFDALEEVTFVGYPNGWADPVHHTPIVRRGISASPITLRFGGRPVFLVDGSVFGGSSGSPVYLFNQGSYSSGGNGITIGSRFILIGIMAETLIRHSQLPLTVGTAPHALLAQELNLGVAFNWEAISETLRALLAAYNIVDEEGPLPVAEAAN